MKVCMLFALAGLLTLSADNAFGLSGDLAGSTMALERSQALNAKLEAGLREQDATALAALFTPDAVCVTARGVFSGRREIAEAFAGDFQRSPATSQTLQTDQLHSLGNEAWSVGQWWRTIGGPDGPVFVCGYWSAIIGCSLLHFGAIGHPREQRANPIRGRSLSTCCREGSYAPHDLSATEVGTSPPKEPGRPANWPCRELAPC